MKAKGATIVAVKLSECYQRTDSRQFTVNPTDAADWRRLIRESAPTGVNFRGVVHLNAAAPASDGLAISELTATQDSGCVSVLHLVQALVHHGAAPRLSIVTRGAQAVRDGEAAAVAPAPLWGFGRVLAREHPEMRVKLFDLDPSPRADDLAALLTVLGGDFDDDQLARREGRLHAARLVPAAHLVADEQPTIRSDATYLLTGGLGGLGLAVAQWLVERGARTLVLAGRRGATPEAESKLTDLRAQGANVIVARADAADPEQLDSVLFEIDHSLPPLRGVMHLAGVLDDGIALHLDRTRLWNVLSPKLRGAWNLHVRTASRQLDFFVLFSSVASMLGSPGQANYAAANAFLDA